MLCRAQLNIECNNRLLDTLCQSKNCPVLVSVLCVFAAATAQDSEDPIAALEQAIPGVPGEDYPIYDAPPETSFACDGFIEGYYADPEAECQAFHICANFGSDDLTKYSFLCPNGTLFNQQYFICDWWFNVDCSQVVSIMLPYLSSSLSFDV